MASKLDRLAAMAREGAKSTVAGSDGHNGQPKVILEHGSGALAEIYAHGATVTPLPLRAAARCCGRRASRSLMARRLFGEASPWSSPSSAES